MENKEIIIETPKGYKKVIKEVEGKTTISFEKIESKELPKEWKLENGKMYYWVDSTSRISGGNRIFESPTNRNVLPSKELAEAMLALCQLLVMRDRYNSTIEEIKTFIIQ